MHPRTPKVRGFVLFQFAACKKLLSSAGIPNLTIPEASFSHEAENPALGLHRLLELPHEVSNDSHQGAGG